MHNPIKDFCVFLGFVKAPPPSPLRIAVDSLEQAQRDLLDAEAGAEEAHAMAEMLSQRVDRLRITVSQLSQENHNAKT